MAIELDAPSAVLLPPADDDWDARGLQRADARNDLDVDRRLGMLSVGLRWLTLSVGIVAALSRGARDVPLDAAVLSLVAFAAWQAVQRPRLDPPDRTLPYMVVIELLLAAIAMSVTGGTRSPLVLTPAIAIVLAGYTFSERQVMACAYGTLSAFAVLAFLGQVSTDATQALVLLGAMYVLCGTLGAFTRHLVVDAARRNADAVDQVARMARANELLAALHGLAQSLPASLDLGEVVVSTRARLRSLFDATVLALYIHDPASGRWRPELAEGVRLSRDLAAAELPTPLLAALAAPGPRLVEDHIADRERGVSPFARSGVYVALRSRGSVVGALAVEHERPRAYEHRDADIMQSIAGPVALAVDNALLFGRLRTLGAETERARIARDLHDRVAQSLVYVAFELERLGTAGSSPASNELHDLHAVVHGMIADLRDTLADLRAAVTASEPLTTLAQGQLARLARRYGVEVRFETRVRVRPPLTVEQELWRIMQEAVHNIGRHAAAKTAVVRYEVSHARTWLEVRDDGKGFDVSAVGRDHYGLAGMRERAAAIGAVLTLDSAPGRGTAVRVTLEVAA